MLEGIFLGLISLFLIATRNYEKEFVKRTRKEDKGMLFPFSLLLWDMLSKLYQKPSRKKDIFDTLKALYPLENETELNRIYCARKINSILVIIIVFLGLSFVYKQTEDNSIFLIGNRIERPDYGEGNEQVKLQIEADNGEENRRFETWLTIEQKKLTEQEKENMLKKAEEYIEEVFLGENKSADQVLTPLNLVKRVPGLLLEIKWESDQEEIISTDGKIQNEDIREAAIVTLTADIQWEEEHIYYPILVKVLPDPVEKEEKIQRIFEEKIKEQKETEYIELPQQIEEYKLQYKEPEKNKNTFLIFLPFAVLFIFLGMDYELSDRLKQRKKQMLIDYPELINRFTLLLGAGIPIRGVWRRIIKEYLEKKKPSKKIRYVYEEMAATWNQIENGISEKEAIEEFGRRIKLSPYIKFTSLLTQNLKMGSDRLIELLEREGIEALELRKQTAKILGEEAGTKILFPMLLLFGIVLVLLMYPALHMV